MKTFDITLEQFKKVAEEYRRNMASYNYWMNVHNLAVQKGDFTTVAIASWNISKALAKCSSVKRTLKALNMREAFGLNE